MNWWAKVRAFLAEVRGELKRTTFPSRREVQGTTTVVVITVFVFALFLYVVDLALFRLVELLFNVAG